MVSVMCAGASAMPCSDSAMQRQRQGGSSGRCSAPAMLQRSHSAPNAVAPIQRGCMELFTVSGSSQCTTSDRSLGTAPSRAAAVLSQPALCADTLPRTPACSDGWVNQVAGSPAPPPATSAGEKPAGGIAVMRAGRMFLKVRLHTKPVSHREVQEWTHRCCMTYCWLLSWFGDSVVS